MTQKTLPCSCLADLAQAYFREIDDALVRAYGALATKGLTVTCSPGCSSCCSLPVNATYPEAVVASVYIREHFRPESVRRLIERADTWLDWCGSELPGLAKGADLSSVYSLYGPGCPMLSGGLCTIYPVRPMGCRVHCSVCDPAFCTPEQRNSPHYNPNGFVEEVVSEVKPFCLIYRQRVEQLGFDFESVVRPLPEMLVELLCGKQPGGVC